MKNNYNSIAAFYDLLVGLVFGKAVMNAQKALLHHIPADAKVLFLGGGSGSMLKHLLSVRPGIRVEYVESSSKMIALSRKKLTAEQMQRVRFVLGNEKQIPQTSYDVVLTFHLLDLFKSEHLQKIFKMLDAVLKEKGYWLVTDFRPSKKRAEKLIEKSMYYFLKLSTNIESNSIPAIEKLFSNYKLIEKRTFYRSFIFSSLYQKCGKIQSATHSS